MSLRAVLAAGSVVLSDMQLTGTIPPDLFGLSVLVVSLQALSHEAHMTCAPFTPRLPRYRS